MSPAFALADHMFAAEEREPGPTWTRAAAAVATVMAVALAVRSASRSDAPGLEVVYSVAWMNLVVVIISGIRSAAPILISSRAYDERTLLELTGTPRSRILASLAGPSVACTLWVVAVQTPAVLLGVPLGGVSAAQALGSLSVLLSTALTISFITLAWSSRCDSHRSAQYLSLLTVILWAVSGAAPFVSSPFEALHRILSPAGGWPSFTFFCSCVFVAFVAWRFTLAGRHRVTDKAAPDAPRPNELDRLRRRGVRRTPLPSDSPLSWREHWFVAGGSDAVGMRVATFVALLVFGFCIWPLFPVALLIDAARLGSRSARAERDAGGWDVLRLLPVTSGELLAMKFRGARSVLAVGWCIMLLPLVFLVTLAYSFGLGRVSAVLLIALMVPLGVVIAWRGAFLAELRGVSNSVSAAVAPLVILGVLEYGACVIAFEVVQYSRRWDVESWTPVVAQIAVASVFVALLSWTAIALRRAAVRALENGATFERNKAAS